MNKVDDSSQFHSNFEKDKTRCCQCGENNPNWENRMWCNPCGKELNAEFSSMVEKTLEAAKEKSKYKWELKA